MADEPQPIPQEIQQYLDAQSGQGASETHDSADAPGMPPDGSLAAGDIDYLLSQAERALESVNAPAGGAGPNVSPFRLRDFGGAPPSAEAATIELIRDVELDLKIELGRAQMYLE